MVYAIPAGPRGSAQTPQGTFTGGQGQFSNLAPGAYRVIALDSFRDLDSMDAQELAKLADKGKTVTVAAGATVPVQLDVIKTSDEGLNP